MTLPGPLTVLADSGPLAALYNRRDKHHQRALDFFRVQGANLRMLTTWEVVSEVMYFLDFSAAAQSDFLEWLHAGHVKGLLTIGALEPVDLPRPGRFDTQVRRPSDGFGRRVAGLAGGENRCD